MTDGIFVIMFNNNMSISSSNTNRNCIKLRIVFLGDQGVGKSSMIDRYTTNRFEQAHNSTVGIDFNVRDISKNGQIYRLQMWDTAGQERYRSLIPTYLKNAQCVVFVYDITRQNSLQNIKIWQKLFKQHQEAPGIIVGNKVDLQSARKVTKEQGQALANELNMKYFQVSAKTSKNINTLFDEVLSTILQQLKKQGQFISQTRQKLRDIKTIIDEGVQTRQYEERKITLKSRALELAKKVACCNSN